MMDTKEENKNEIEEEEIKYEDSDSYRRQAQKFSQSAVEDIQLEIQEVTKLIEHEKINLRISTERYEKQFVHHCELQGKPVPMNKEQKEKERREHREQKKTRKLNEPAPRKMIPEKEMQESRIKTLKEISKNETELEFLTNEINEIVLNNQELKKQIEDIRKQKHIVTEQRDIIVNSNREKEKIIEELRKNNKTGKGKIKVKKEELGRSLDQGHKQNRNFKVTRDELEGDYFKIIEEFIKRERETKKEQAKKRQILAMVADSKSTFKGSNALELEKQIKLMASEEISDRTPILDQIVTKWKYINKVKKYMIEKYANNSACIEVAFDRMMKFFEVDRYEDLPIVFKKTMNQIATIDMHLGELQNETTELAAQRNLLQEKIKFLTDKKDQVNENKSTFAEEKEAKIQGLMNRLDDLNQDIKIKRALFLRLQPGIDEYLNKLNQTYLAEYVSNRLQVDPCLKYSETTVGRFLSNVEDYYKLIQLFEEGTNEMNTDPESRELNRLRNEIKVKLENYEKDKLLGYNFYVTMKNDTKNGLEYDEMIRRSSEIVLNNVYSPMTSPTSTMKKKKKNN